MPVLSFQLRHSGRVGVAYLCHLDAWVPDELRTHCSVCRETFSFFTRKHHCRLCGEVICMRCCRYMRFHDTHRVRACVDCEVQSRLVFSELPRPSPLTLPTTRHRVYGHDAAHDEDRSFAYWAIAILLSGMWLHGDAAFWLHGDAAFWVGLVGLFLIGTSMLHLLWPCLMTLPPTRTPTKG
ncbi:hypothetical protein SPRG_11932 [Saprolegnia parasitica CBS 223.65]|uniref:FYVE-type domain-containing protein n=1 Tax=Saprolegnia parasitica (strain CBS 223.65) TaxID=695850 RepID=A0A067BXT9_SAPPC|nr:hypothetical protein SPRG_11932 [Saprolegnia parasitica CBS 223.65]KDO23088.1 hypothetical protein SPRG_11932 [Saprolegnia parasitica CBS 223.65]|eukprot:XP_012206200.1 hypothetical protein SPRG_11932 [Saprolegnia parasitica CBS 223.65]